MLCLSPQWTGSGRHGAAGAPAPCPAGEAAGRERAAAQTQPHSSGVTNAKETTYKLIFATVILVRVSALHEAGCGCTRGRKETLHKSRAPTKIRRSEKQVSGFSCLARAKAHQSV